MVRMLSRVDVCLCLQQHVTYNSVTRSKSREKEMEKKDTDVMQGRSKEKKEEKDRKERKRVSVWDYQPSPPPRLRRRPQSSSATVLTCSFSSSFPFRIILSMIARRAKNPNIERMKMEPVRLSSHENWSFSSTSPHGAKLQTFLPRFFQNQHKPFLRLAALSRERERQKIQVVQQREGRVSETWAHLLRGQEGHSPPPLVDERPSLLPLLLIWTQSRLCCRSPGTRKRNQKRKKKETASEEKKRKSNILDWSPDQNFAYLFLSLHFN